jgi:type II secretory pathway pseudopilin PulG
MKRQSGFTIVELLIYCGILTVFLYVMTNIFTSVLDMQLESETASAVVTDGRYILSRLTYDIGRASSIVTPASLGAQTANLVLHIGASDYTYAVANGNLVLTSGAVSGALNGYGTQISNVSFRRYGNVNGKNSVRVMFTLTSVTQRRSGPETRDYETTIGLQ